MTVAELIEKLKTFDPTLEVEVRDDEYGNREPDPELVQYTKWFPTEEVKRIEI